jgi:hypothetical protein
MSSGRQSPESSGCYDADFTRNPWAWVAISRGKCAAGNGPLLWIKRGTLLRGARQHAGGAGSSFRFAALNVGLQAWQKTPWLFGST